MAPKQLYVWGPAFNVPSIDPRCLVVETYMRFLRVDYTVVHANDPQYSPTGELPLLKDGNVWVAGATRILAHLAKHNLDANESLSDTEKADSYAYSALIQDKLYDCMIYTWYADTTNFVKNIRPTYAKLLSFPSRYLTPIQLKKAAKARLSKYNVEIKDDDKGLPQNEVEEMKELQRTGWHFMYRLARDTYSTLNQLLGEKSFLFGDRPTTLDAIAFGYLALHLYPDLAHRRLQHILTTEYPRLARYCDRIKETYFAADLVESQAAEDVPSFWRTLTNNPKAIFNTVKSDIAAYMGNTNEGQENRSQAEIEFQRKRIWSIAGGLTFLFAYIIYNGIVSIDFGEDDEEDDFEYVYDDQEEYYDDELEA
ncbi:Tom37 C-terminal domain-domain-containing protein [Syncephalastrum racemosum]|uniref:Tom37 C-terminal domain-domain-containing protein n=1 Tax=Syncephalastrum racemosum TaxID=13706 RepID=A0A1X2HIF3_SYNRA|nr:Tom37 C-terminal domain-domain-containing protein [Syncephalastrum racemosum]